MIIRKKEGRGLPKYKEVSKLILNKADQTENTEAYRWNADPQNEDRILQSQLLLPRGQAVGGGTHALSTMTWSEPRCAGTLHPGVGVCHTQSLPWADAERGNPRPAAEGQSMEGLTAWRHSTPWFPRSGMFSFLTPMNWTCWGACAPPGGPELQKTAVCLRQHIAAHVTHSGR